METVSSSPADLPPSQDDIRAAVRSVQYARLYFTEDINRQSNLIEQLLSLASLRLRAGEHAKTESLLREALTIHKEMKRPSAVLGTEIWTQLAILHERRGDAAKAEEFCQRAHADAITSGILDRVEGAALCFTLARLCLKLGNAPRAIEYGRKALAAQQRVSGEEGRPTAEAANFLGEASLAIGKAEEALHWHERALRIQQSNPAPDPNHAVAEEKATYRFLAKAAEMLGQPKLAAEYAKLGKLLPVPS